MAYWLFKSEPSAWSWDQQEKSGKAEAWTGVRNFQATNNMKAMKKGDLGFFYHSNEGKSIVGIVEVAGEYAPDPTDKEGRFGCVSVKAKRAMPKPVTLADIKAKKELQDMALVRLSRLSVQPVTPAEWKLICGMGGI